MAELFFNDTAIPSHQVNLLMNAVGLPETFDMRWPGAGCSNEINEGIKARVLKNDRPTALRLPLGERDSPCLMSLTLADFSNLGTEGYWSARVSATGRLFADRGEEVRPVLSHVVAGSSDEGYVDREVKRITLFRSVPRRVARAYLCEVFLRALDWRGAGRALGRRKADNTKLHQRFVSIMVSDLWSFPTICVEEIEKWILDDCVGKQHFDVPGVRTRHTRQGVCPCKKLQGQPDSQSYLIFGAEKVLLQIRRQLAKLKEESTRDPASA